MKLLGYTLLATLIFVSSLVSIKNAGAATLTESPGNIAKGGTVTATWSGVVAPSNRDWIGLYKPSEPDTSTNFIDWIYDNSCNRAGNNSALAVGSCPFLIPNSLPNGTYELRLYANNNYILLAKSGTFSVAPTPPARYVDNGDGTITDTQTALQWEQKLAANDVGGDCANATQANRSVRCVNNLYQWSSTGTLNDGPLFTDFLAKLTLSTSGDGTTLTNTCLAGHCDWRIPDIAELRTILLAPFPCGTNPCIDPIFGPAAANYYWSSTTNANNPDFAWVVLFIGGLVGFDFRDSFYFARAVRGGR